MDLLLKKSVHERSPSRCLEFLHFRSKLFRLCRVKRICGMQTRCPNSRSSPWPPTALCCWHRWWPSAPSAEKLMPISQAAPQCEAPFLLGSHHATAQRNGLPTPIARSIGVRNHRSSLDPGRYRLRKCGNSRHRVLARAARGGPSHVSETLSRSDVKCGAGCQPAGLFTRAGASNEWTTMRGPADGFLESLCSPGRNLCQQLLRPGVPLAIEPGMLNSISART